MNNIRKCAPSNNRRRKKRPKRSLIKRHTMANMPLAHKRRIVSTIHAVHGSIDGLKPIEKCCHLSALMGAEILIQCYGIPAEVVPCRAMYIFDPVGEYAPTVMAFEERNSTYIEAGLVGSGIGHSIVVAESGDPKDKAKYLVDFQSPVFNKMVASSGCELPYLPGLMWERYDDKGQTNFFLEPSPVGEQFIKGLRADPRYADIIRMAVSWYTKPPKKMRDRAFANAVPNKPETMRFGVLRYTPLVIQDNIHTPIEALR